MTALWIALAVAYLVAVLGFARCLRNAPLLPDFDEHAATAAALLRPDHPIFTEADEARFAAEWLAYVDSLPTTCERKYKL